MNKETVSWAHQTWFDLEHLDYNTLAQVDIASSADANNRLLELSTAFGKLVHAVALDFKPSSFDYGIEQLRWNRPEIFNLLEEVTSKLFSNRRLDRIYKYM